MTYRHPFLEVMGPGASDLVKTAGSRLIGVKLVDHGGDQSDEAIITLTDGPPYFPVPGLGTPYVVRLGWSELSAVITGVYTFQRVHFFGAPKEGRKVQLICRAGDLNKDLKQMGSEHFDQETGHKTYGDVFRSLFKGMNVAIAPEIAGKALPGSTEGGGYLLRWKQSAIDFATQLGEENGWVVKPQGGKMVVMDLAAGLSGSGKDLPTLIIRYDPNYEYDVELEPRYSVEEMGGFFFDPAKGIETQDDPEFRRRRPGSGAAAAPVVLQGQRRRGRQGSRDRGRAVQGERSLRDGGRPGGRRPGAGALHRLPAGN